MGILVLALISVLITIFFRQMRRRSPEGDGPCTTYCAACPPALQGDDLPGHAAGLRLGADTFLWAILNSIKTLGRPSSPARSSRSCNSSRRWIRAPVLTDSGV